MDGVRLDHRIMYALLFGWSTTRSSDNVRFITWMKYVLISLLLHLVHYNILLIHEWVTLSKVMPTAISQGCVPFVTDNILWRWLKVKWCHAYQQMALLASSQLLSRNVASLSWSLLPLYFPYLIKITWIDGVENLR